MSCLPFTWENQNPIYDLKSQFHAVTKKWLQRPETGIKDGWKKLEHKFPFETFCMKKQDYLLRCSSVPGNFPLKKKVVLHWVPSEYS